jgi:hypothetical protein
MHDLTIYAHYFDKIGSTAKMLFSKPLGILTMFCIVTMPALTTTQMTLMFLGGLFIGDFITGIMASYYEFKKSLPVLPGSGKRYVLSSAKMRMSGVKFITYAMGIVSAYALETIFLIDKFKPTYITKQHLTLTTIVTLFFCVIEFYSIFFENIKRMDFDIIQKVKSIFSAGWDIYKSAKDEKKESN